MLKIKKPPEWWAMRPQCPRKQCTGKIVNLKCKLTDQVLLCCEKCLTFFVGILPPTKDTPCISANFYNNMLCLDEESWEMTEEDVTSTWDVDHYFKHIYNPHRSPLATKSLTGDKGTEICPLCTNLEEYSYHKDGRGHVHRIKHLKQNHLQLAHIPHTGQNVQYCRFCDSVWPEYREPNDLSSDGTLDMYLAFIGAIQFCET
jgi:hypothetical protein